MEPHELSQPALHAIAYDRVADLAAHTEAEAGRARLRLHYRRDHEAPTMPLGPLFLHTQELGPPPQSEVLAKAERCDLVRRRTVAGRDAFVRGTHALAPSRLCGHLHGETFAAFTPASLQHVLPSRGCHTRQEPVGSLTPQVARLVRALHPLRSFPGELRAAARAGRSKENGYSPYQRSDVNSWEPPGGADRADAQGSCCLAWSFLGAQLIRQHGWSRRVVRATSPSFTSAAHPLRHRRIFGSTVITTRTSLISCVSRSRASGRGSSGPLPPGAPTSLRGAASTSAR